MMSGSDANEDCRLGRVISLEVFWAELCGIFENYLKEVFAEAAKDLQHRIGRYDDPWLPARIRERNVLNYVRWVARARIPNLDKVTGVEGHARAIASMEINFESFDKTNANPNSETIREMFLNVGVEDVFARIEPEYNAVAVPALSAQTIIQTIDSFIRTRNQYAHLGNTGAHTRNDLAHDVRFIGYLALAIDRVLVQHVNGI